MPCIHNSIDMQGAAQAALQGLSQHPAAPSRLAHASGPANVAAAANESPSSVATALDVAAEPASIEAVEPAAGVASEPAAPMAAEPASIIAGPACTKAAEPPLPSIGDPPLARIEQTAAEAACLVAGSAVEEEAKQATGLTPAVNHMLESTVRQGGSRCTGTGLIAFVSGDFQ